MQAQLKTLLAFLVCGSACAYAAYRELQWLAIAALVGVLCVLYKRQVARVFTAALELLKNTLEAKLGAPEIKTAAAAFFARAARRVRRASLWQRKAARMKDVFAVCRFAALMLAASMGVARAQQATRPAVIELPFQFVHGAVVVQVRLENQGPFNMLLDTGADPSVVDLQTAKSLQMKLSKDGVVGSGGGTDANLAFETQIANLQVGALRVRRIAAAAMDLSGVGTALGLPIEGVLGRSLMKGRVFQIDYPGRMVRFYAVSPLNERRPALDTARRTTLFYRYENDFLLEGVKINGRAALANLDTGSNGNFQIAPAAVAPLGLAADLARGTPTHSTGFNGDTQNKSGQVDRIDVGSIAIDHPRVDFYGKGTGRDDVAWSVRIGNSFLKDYVLTIDDSRKIVRIEKP